MPNLFLGSNILVLTSTIPYSLPMNYHSDIIQIINSRLMSDVLCDPVFTGGSINGIATDATDVDSTATRSYPVISDIYGSGTCVNPDDSYPIQIYHRLLGKTYNIKPASVGDRSNVVGEKTEVKMVVAAWSQKIGMTQEDLESLIASDFPDQISSAVYIPLRLQNLVITLQSSTLDRAQVWREEYKGVPYQVKPEQILFAVKYQIEAMYKKGCFTLTPCQPESVPVQLPV